jgi:ATP-dependent DNA helicase RecG
MKRLIGKHSSTPYNPLLANAFFRAGYIEAWGRGIEKMARECHEHGIAVPVYDFGMSGLMLTFHANPKHLIRAQMEQETTQGTTQETLETTKEAQETTQETTQEILELLRRNPSISRREITESLGKNITEDGVKYHLDKLKFQKMIKRIGHTKGGYWKVTRV